MTLAIKEIPDYEGEPVSRVAIKFTGAGTGLSESLSVKPIVLDLDDEAYFVIRVKASESASHYRDKNGLLVRLHRVHTESMAPIDKDRADKALTEYADVIERAKADASGQLLLDAENDALAKEAND